MTEPAERPSLIETLRVNANRGVPLLAGHMARLHDSARALGYAAEMAVVERAVLDAAAALTEPGEHRLRLLLDADGRVTVQTSALRPLPSEPRIVLAGLALDAGEPLLRHKTTHRPWFDADAAWLVKHPDVFDCIHLNNKGELCEGSRSNVYLRLDGQWWTPALASGCLPGVQRAVLLAQGLVQERTLPASLLQEAQALRVSNALRGWVDVTLRA